MLVEVRPIEREPWHKKKGKESFTRTKVITCLYDPKIGGYATGLTKEDVKHFQKLFPNDDLNNTFNPEKPHEFWESERFQIKLPNHTVVFNTDNPIEALQIKILKASRFVANSMKDVVDGIYPDATHVIFDEAEQIDVEAKKVEMKNKAVELSAKMTLDEKHSIIQVMDNVSTRHQSGNYVTVALNKIIEKDPELFIKYALMDKATLYLQATILEAIHKGVLKKEQGGSIFYFDEKLGYDLDSTVEYLSNPDNNQLKVKILGKLTE